MGISSKLLAIQNTMYYNVLHCITMYYNVIHCNTM